MGILEIHFHDSQFEWTFSPGSDEERSFSVGVGDESESGRSESDETPRPSVAPKLRSAGLVALVVGGAVAFRRLRSWRARTAAESDGDSSSTGRRLSLSRSQ